ncbi:MAG: hypothetical protein H6713_09830 [Myxococcales bacterium]|nr:hypothetical protein [Myxococcales bacterium]MCB9750285.1 hypothetical protein [Myxococcales bacterium]
MARASYAYGVDVRRARWFANSSLSQTAMRAIELRWHKLVAKLTPHELAYPDDPEVTPLLDEVSALAHLLHMRPPGVRLLTPDARTSGDWGLATPMGNVRGSEDWLVLDAEGLRAQPPGERAFLLGAAMGHLQCGHGPIFVSHFVGHRAGGGRLIRRLLTPWTSLAVFSADRAGLLAAGGLEPALMGLGTAAAERVSWYPNFAPLHQRRQALEDFDRSRVAARVRTRVALARARVNLYNKQTDDEAGDTRVPRGVPEDAWPLARCDQRLTRRLRLL